MRHSTHTLPTVTSTVRGLLVGAVLAVSATAASAQITDAQLAVDGVKASWTDADLAAAAGKGLCSEVNVSDLNWRMTITRNQPVNRLPFGQWDNDSFGNYIALYSYCNHDKPEYQDWLTALRNKAWAFAEARKDADRQRQMSERNAAKSIAEQQERDAKLAQAQAERNRLQAAKLALEQHAPPPLPAHQAKSAADLVPCEQFDPRQPAWQQAMVRDRDPFDPNRAMSDLSATEYSDYLAAYDRCNANLRSYAVRSTRQWLELEQSKNENRNRAAQDHPELTRAQLGERGLHGELSPMEQAGMDLNRERTAKATASILAQCKDPNTLATVKSLIERPRNRNAIPVHVLKIYGVQAFGATSTGSVAADYMAQLSQSMAGQGITLPERTTTLPNCTASVMTDQGDQAWTYGWRVIDGETFITAEQDN